MNKKVKIYIFIFVVILIIAAVNDAMKPKPIDWSASFLSSHKIPYGSYVLYQELDHFFPNSKVRKVNISPYEYLSKNYKSIFEDTINDNREKNYIFLNDNLNIDEESSIKLLDFVDKGNNVMMIGHYLPRYLSDTLNFRAKGNVRENDIVLKLANKEISRTKYSYTKALENRYFTELDSTTTTVLGYSIVEEEESINFVKIKYGKGNFIFNLQPYAFTNYHMLESDHAVYVRDCLSYLSDNSKLIWDERSKAQTGEIDSPLRFLMSKEALKYAWYTTFFSILLFIIFKAKRRQRIVPIIEPLPNTSIAFAKTIGNLYYQEGKPLDIITIKITYFLEYLRSTYMLDTQNLNTELKKRLQAKTGIPQEEVNRLIDYIIRISKNSEPRENSLVTLNKLMDKFYKKTKL